MRTRRLSLCVSVLLTVALASFAGVRSANADPSEALVGSLAALQSPGPGSFGNVAGWARNGAPQVLVPIRDYERAEAQILNLSSDDRQAVLGWLQGNGRSALYARGVSDAAIGPLRSGVDPGAVAPTPAPNSWRDLQLASATLGDAAPPSGIVCSAALQPRCVTARAPWPASPSITSRRPTPMKW